MNGSVKILKASLFIGGVYFLLVSAAHFMGWKIPGFFVYYAADSYEYQDKIISFLTFGWAVFYLTAATCPVKYRMVFRAVLISSAAAVIGLCAINLNTDFSAIAVNFNPSTMWLITGILAVYLAWLIFWYYRM